MPEHLLKGADIECDILLRLYIPRQDLRFGGERIEEEGECIVESVCRRCRTIQLVDIRSRTIAHYLISARYLLYADEPRPL